MKNFIALLIIAINCCACSSIKNASMVSNKDRQWLLSGEALPGNKGTELTLPDENTLYLSEEMREFAKHAVKGFHGRDRVKALLNAILYPDGLDLKYDAQASLTAEEVFDQRRANCLSFTHLFVAMGRYLDMDVKYNEVNVPPVWDLRRGNTLVLNKHINAMVTRNYTIRHVIDLNVEEYDMNYQQETIEDSLALAQHYNNKAMNYLVAEDYPEALRYLVKAIRLESKVSYLWNNLGSLYRRAGNNEAAELAYRAALIANDEDLVAISNIARLYDETGNEKMARYYEEKAHQYRLENPYYLYGLAQQAFVDNDYAVALEHVKAAIHRFDKEHRFYFLLGGIYQKTGDNELAEKNFNKALELSTDEEQQARYRNKIDRINFIN